MTTTTTTTSNRAWFDVDKQGLAALLDRRGRWRVLAELVSNAFDENITECHVGLATIGERGVQGFTIEDDSPEGFRTLSDAFTLFAPSYKTTDPEKRGRFNLGEKLFLAICRWANLSTTTGEIEFGDRGRTLYENRKRELGSKLSAHVQMTKKDAEKAVAHLRTIIAPTHVTYTVNGVEVPHRMFVKLFGATLPTEFQDGEGSWRSTARSTSVILWEPEAGETPHIYEMGIPVVEADFPWHIDVGQKVPLNSDRDNVTPSYLRSLRTAVLDNTVELLSNADTTSTWVKDGLPQATDETVREIVTKRFGDKLVVFDPSDRQANKEAAAQGYTVIPPATFDKATWERVREATDLRPAGQVTPSNSEILTSTDGIPPIPEEQWTPKMTELANYSVAVADDLLGKIIGVQFYSSITIPAAAFYGNRTLSFNLGRLGKAWVESPNQHAVDALLIHEFAHEYASDHLDHAYYRALCDLGARFRDVDYRLKEKLP